MPDCNPNYFEAEVVPSAQRNTNGTSGTLESFAGYSQIKVFVLIESVQVVGSQVPRFSLEESADGTHWAGAGAKQDTSITTSTVNHVFTFNPGTNVPTAERLRVAWDLLGGTATFSVRLIARK